MERASFARKPHGRVELDVCYGCHAIWFDQYESAQLTPGSVIELFGRIHEHRDQPPRPLGGNPRCPHCRKALQVTQDIQRTNRITYSRCPEGHGRLTTFLQFLREKNFVRSLTPAEVQALRAHVAQVRCSGCGAPVDVARDAACGYCRSPLAILDADAVRKTLAELGAAEQKGRVVDPFAGMDALIAGQRIERDLARAQGRGYTAPGTFDIVEEGLGLIMGAFRATEER
jgi:hypothetical protein